jgi:hypothetical protein
MLPTMHTVNGLSCQAVLSVLTDTLATVSPNLGGSSAQTPLMGGEAVLDSVGFVTFLVSLEQNLGNRVDLVSSFSDQGNAGEQDHPFRTVGSLAEHIHRTLAAEGV